MLNVLRVLSAPVLQNQRTRLVVLLQILTSCLMISCETHAQDCNVTVKVFVPASTPARDSIFIAGNLPLLGNWNPGAVKLQRQSDSVWLFNGDVPAGRLVEFKITRGSWNTQAIYQAGVIPSNSELIAQTDTVFTVRPLMWSDHFVSEGKGITGTVRYHKEITGKGLHHSRDVIVWLPQSYESLTDKRYPVLYMHDGQNVFDPSTSFIGYDWHVDEVADSLMRTGKMEEVLIVGIYNTPDRLEEYSDSDLGRAYAAFVVHELKPLIDRTYRTIPEREKTGVMGSSLGGVISFLITWWYPEVFSRAACLSNAFWHRGGSVLKEIEADDMTRRSIILYLDVGEKEPQLIGGNEAMVQLLERKGYKRGKDLVYFLAEGAEHNERAWAERVWRPLTFLFGK